MLLARTYRLPAATFAYKQGAYLFADLQAVDPHTREQNFALLTSNLGGGTDETPALLLAKQLLDGTEVDRRMVIVLTDGEAGADTPATLQWLRQEPGGYEVTGIGIGDACHNVQRVYQQHVVVDVLEQLPQQLGEVLKDTLLRDD